MGFQYLNVMPRQKLTLMKHRITFRKNTDIENYSEFDSEMAAIADEVVPDAMAIDSSGTTVTFAPGENEKRLNSKY